MEFVLQAVAIVFGFHRRGVVENVDFNPRAGSGRRVVLDISKQRFLVTRTDLFESVRQRRTRVERAGRE